MEKKDYFTSIYDERISYRLTLSFALMGIIPMLLSTYIIAALWLPSVNVWTQVSLLLSFSLLVSVLGYLLSRTVVRTIFRTSEVAKEIAGGNLSKRIEVRNARAEINSLVDSFNRITNQLEEKIREAKASEERYKHLVDNVPDLLYYLEPDGVISSVNNEVKELLGFEQEELVGCPFSQIVHPEDYEKYELILKERRSDEQRLTKGLQIRLKTSHNHYRVFEINSRGTYDRDNNFVGTEGIARDITAQLALEAEREEFLYMLSHDIRNPISAILFTIYMMRDGTIPVDKFAEYYEKIERSCNGMSSLVEDFLEFKKLDRGHTALDFRKVDLRILLKHIVATYCSESQAKGKTLVLNADAPVFVSVDEKYFQRSVENLITNALKFAKHRIQVDLMQNDDYVNILVHDDGPGVSDEEKQHIFKLFHRSPGSRMIKGIGIGLASAERIVHAHRGTLQVESKEGKGCCFIIRIPRNQDGIAGRHSPDHLTAVGT